MSTERESLGREGRETMQMRETEQRMDRAAYKEGNTFACLPACLPTVPFSCVVEQDNHLGYLLDTGPVLSRVTS